MLDEPRPAIELLLGKYDANNQGGSFNPRVKYGLWTNLMKSTFPTAQ
jgi:hypothetical protein